MHLRQGTVTAVDVSPQVGSGAYVLRLVHGTGVYKDPDGWLTADYFPSSLDPAAPYGFAWRLTESRPTY